MQIQDTGNGGHYPLYYLFLLKAATHLPEIRRIELESCIANIIPLLVGSYFKHDPKEKRIELTSFIHVTIETAKVLIKGTVLLKQIEKLLVIKFAKLVALTLICLEYLERKGCRHTFILEEFDPGISFTGGNQFSFCPLCSSHKLSENLPSSMKRHFINPIN